MSERTPNANGERRLRRIADTKATRQPPTPVEPAVDPNDADDVVENSALWMEQRTLWIDGQIRRAIERGEFDNLPGQGKPIPGLGGPYDPNWWFKRLIEREHLTGLGPAGLQLRKEDAELDARLDNEVTEREVSRILTDFNERVTDARRQLRGGPPVTTSLRDVGHEAEAWRTRRAQRIEERRQQRRTAEDERPAAASPRRRRWWRR
jgi:hypothetical protein